MKDREKKTHRLSRKTWMRGTRGAISILLCLLLTPFVTVTLGLVEYARYQQVVELCDEVYELTGMSILSDYDPYLQQRYGLLATSQTGDLSSAGAALLEENMDKPLEGLQSGVYVPASGGVPEGDDYEHSLGREEYALAHRQNVQKFPLQSKYNASVTNLQ